jgi:hypothetical protein
MVVKVGEIFDAGFVFTVGLIDESGAGVPDFATAFSTLSAPAWRGSTVNVDMARHSATGSTNAALRQSASAPRLFATDKPLQRSAEFALACDSGAFTPKPLVDARNNKYLTVLIQDLSS